MKALLLLGTAACFAATLFVLRIVLHAYVDHDHLDLFHLGVGIATAIGGSLLLRRAYARGAASS